MSDPQADWSALGELVRAHRINLEIGVRELARRIDKSASLVVRLEKGETTASDETLISLASELHMSHALIYGTLGRCPPRYRPRNPAEASVVTKALREHRLEVTSE